MNAFEPWYKPWECVRIVFWTSPIRWLRRRNGPVLGRELRAQSRHTPSWHIIISADKQLVKTKIEPLSGMIYYLPRIFPRLQELERVIVIVIGYEPHADPVFGIGKSFQPSEKIWKCMRLEIAEILIGLIQQGL